MVGTENIASVSIKYNVKKIIYAASSSCYGIPDKYPTSESESIKPQYPYALTKNLGEQILINYAKIYGLHFTSLRLLMYMALGLERQGLMVQCLVSSWLKKLKKTSYSSR